MARAPGVGPKVAARIVAELKDKMPALAPRDQARRRRRARRDAPRGGVAARDAVSALTNLGYGHAQAAAAVPLPSARPGARRAPRS